MKFNRNNKGFLILVSLNCCFGFQLRVLKVEISDEDSAGMDGGNFFIRGGQLKLKICTSSECCETKDRLNTEDNNWEKNEINYFVGTQLHECQNMELPTDESSRVNITWKHTGTNGIKINKVWMRGSLRHQPEWTCDVGFKLDNLDEKEFECRMDTEIFVITGGNGSLKCNGRRKFCNIPFNKFLFPGTHNSGTGQSANVYLPSLFKNQDLTVTEQLDFGIRFLDFDVYYINDTEHIDGLMTGHGESSTVYQCFDTMTNVFIKIRDWMSQHPSEVIVLYFGLLRPDQNLVIPALNHSLKNYFSEQVQINYDWITNEKWPTLEEAIKSNQRIFAIVRDKKPYEEGLTRNFIREVQVKDKGVIPNENDPGSITVLSTYKSMNIGKKCSDIVANIDSTCEKYATVDFIKVAVFGTFVWNWTPLNVLARDCNPRIEEALNRCEVHLTANNRTVNFVQIDFPNYPGSGRKTVVQIAEDINMKRAILYN